MPVVKLLAMLAKQDIAGDDALLLLAKARFQEAGLGAEIYPESLEQFQHLLKFCPAGGPCTVHLPRDINLLLPEGRARVKEYALECAGRIYGLTVHDHFQFEDRPREAQEALRDLERQLTGIGDSPQIFVEYASGLPLECYLSLFEETTDLRLVSACIDVSHVGIMVCWTTYLKVVPNGDIFRLYHSRHLQERIETVQQVVAGALPAVVSLIRRLGRLGKPLHFHLHDGHPLSTMSPYGIADHLSFLQEIRLPFSYQGRQLLGGMFGPAGLRALVQAALGALPPEQLSFMIEVHPQEGWSPLGPQASLFRHWKDTANAERMNYWLDLLLLNVGLLRDALHPHL